MKDLTIKYIDEPVGSREATTPSAAGLQAFSDLDDMLTLENQAPAAATFEDDYWRLGTDFKFFPDNPGAYKWGLYSTAMCGADGVFTTPQVLTLVLDGAYSAVGITLEFDRMDTWCRDLTIAWYSSGEVIHTQDFAPNGWRYFCQASVTHFDQVVITFRAMSHGYRYLKVQSIVYGLVRVFDSSECFSVDMYQDTDLVSDQLSVNTLDFVLRNESAVAFLFQRKQILRARYDTQLLGMYYIKSGKKTGKNRYEVSAVDMVGLLEMAGDHFGGIYTGQTALAVATEICGDVPFSMAAELQTVPVYGYLAKDNRRENLRQLAFALGAMVATGHREHIAIEKPGAGTALSFAAHYAKGSVNTETLVTAVTLEAHNWAEGGDAQELFNGALDGTATVAFSGPMYGLTITGGLITSSTVNGAVIAGTGGTVVLTGASYVHNTRVYQMSNPDVGTNDAENVIDYTGMTLVSYAGAPPLLQELYNFNLRRVTVSGKVLTEIHKPGDRVSIETEDDGIITGHLVSLDYAPTGKLAATVEVLAETEAET